MTAGLLSAGCRFVAEHPLRIVLAWLALIVVLHATTPAWDDVTVDGDLAHLPADVPSSRGQKLLAEAFPDAANQSSLVFIFARRDVPLSRQDRDLAIRLAERVRTWDEAIVRDVWTETTTGIGRMLRSRDRKSVLVVVQLSTEFMAVGNIAILERSVTLADEFAESAPDGLAVGVTGSASIGADMLASASESIRNTHWATIALVLAALTIIYRSPILVAVPVLTIAASLFVATDLLAQLAVWLSPETWSWSSFRVFKTTKIFIIVVLFGAGTDYCLFLISRCREFVQEGRPPAEAVRESLLSVGPALLASALTTVVGLAMMGWSEFGKFSSSGPAIAVSLIVTLAASLTLAPALVRLIQQKFPSGLEAFAIRSRATANPLEPSSGGPWSARIWQSVARIVTDRPATVLMASVLLLVPLAVRGWEVPVTYDLVSELQADRPSRRGMMLLENHFEVGRLAPLTVVVQTNSGDLVSDRGREKTAILGKQLHDLHGVARVLSLDQPFGDPPGATSIFTSAGLATMAARHDADVEAAFVSQEPHIAGQVARLQLLLSHNPFSAQALDTLEQIELVLDRFERLPAWQDTVFEVAGVTAGIHDLREITLADRSRIQWLVVLAVYVVLLILLRRPFVSAYLILTVLLTYFVTIGATELLFAWLYGDSYVGIDWKVPIFLFVILVAVGEDYNIYIITRILEEQPRLGHLAGIRAALVNTGGVVTSCGVIMAGTFIAMTTGTLRGMIELGFALALGILLDTFVVRTILVPAFMALMRPSMATSLLPHAAWGRPRDETPPAPREP